MTGSGLQCFLTKQGRIGIWLLAMDTCTKLLPYMPSASASLINLVTHDMHVIFSNMSSHHLLQNCYGVHSMLGNSIPCCAMSVNSG